MKDPDIKLWKQALQEAMEEKQNELLASVTEEVTPSAQHLRRVSRILGVSVVDERPKRYPAKRVLAWGLAAVLLMTCALTAYAYNGAELGFVERKYGAYTQVSFAVSDDALAADRIVEAYELGYVPNRYVRTRVYVHDQRVECVYQNGKGDEIEFQQYPLGADEAWGFRNEFGDTEIKRYGERYLYCYNCEDSRTFLWRDQKYAMVLCVGAEMSDTEILKIISGISVQAQ